MTDTLELLNMDIASDYSDEAMYQTVNFVQVSDQQGGVYPSGQVSYDTTSLKENAVVHPESYFALPITNTLTADTDRITVKNSILSLIQGVSVDTMSGQTLVSENMSTPILNNLRLLIDSSIDFQTANDLMYYGKDQNLAASTRATALGAVGGALPMVTSAESTIDPLHNPALATRIQVYQTRSNAVEAGHKRTFVAYIPLKFIHDFFRCMDFPVYNCPLKITFNISNVNGYANYCPFTCPSFAAHRTLGNPDATSGVTVTGADAAALITDIALKTLAPAVAACAKPSTIIERITEERLTGFAVKPSLWMKVVTFRSKEAEELASKIKAGYEMTRTFTVSQAFTSNQTTAKINQQIGQNIIRPTRLWVLPLKTGTLSDADNTFPARIGPNGLRDVQIKLNGSNFYKSYFRSQYELFREFKQQLIAAGSSQSMCSPISYEDWLFGLNPHCFDLSRDPVVKSNGKCTLDIEATTFVLSTGAEIAVNYELWCVVERLRTIKISISAGGVSITPRDGAD